MSPIVSSLSCIIARSPEGRRSNPFLPESGIASPAARPRNDLWVLKETLPAFLTQPAGLYVARQQRGGAVAVFAGLLLQAAHHAQHHVQADQVAPLERAARIVRAELHGRVNIRGRSQG